MAALAMARVDGPPESTSPCRCGGWGPYNMFHTCCILDGLGHRNELPSSTTTRLITHEPAGAAIKTLQTPKTSTRGS